MNLQEFYSVFESIVPSYEWYGPSLRGYDKSLHLYVCPLTAVCYVVTGESFDVGDYPQAAQALKLSKKDYVDIALAADLPVGSSTNPSDEQRERRAIRQKLRSFCHLPEEA